ncbi:MAG: glycosyltransferase [Planctomycetota bacterium]
MARHEWEARHGKGCYVLSSVRLDKAVKGYDESLFQTLAVAAKKRPQLRFIFLAWGTDVAAFRSWIENSGFSRQFILLSPVGKKRLIDYYRSCDIVLDQFTYGYYGSTALEAASIGKPVLMKLRADQYQALYDGDAAPVINCNGETVGQAIIALTDNAEYRIKKGTEMRDWLIRNHGERKTVPLMLALLRLAADHVPLPRELINPLLAEETEEERVYHSRCLKEVS